MFAKTGKACIGYLCDVDDRRAAAARKAYPQAAYYKDWRRMLDKEAKNIDGLDGLLASQRPTLTDDCPMGN